MKRLLVMAVVPMLLAAVPASSAAPAGGREVSFREPLAFATGATPSSAEFNRAEGDQLVNHISRRAPLSDSVAVGDFDGDGRPDVAQTNVIAGSVSVFLGDGQGGFASPRLHAVGKHPVFVVAGHLDRDGKLDLAVANMGSHDVAILRGNGQGGFLPASFLPVPVPRNVAIGEFDGDGIPDLAVTSSAPAFVTPGRPPVATAGGVAILTGTAGGTYVPAQFIATTAGNRPVNANYVAAADFDADGRDDLAVGTGVSSNAYVRRDSDTQLTGDDVLIFRNQQLNMGLWTRAHDGHDTSDPPAAVSLFSTAPEQRIRVGAWPVAIAVADLNDDATSDLAVLDAASGDITTLLGDGAGEFRLRAKNVTVGSIPRSVAVADFDDDGNPDLVTASFSASTVSVLAGNGDGTLQPAVDFWSGDATTSVAVGDFDADGRPDVVAGRLRDDHLALLRNASRRRGDGVGIERDISYISPAGDPFAGHHTLDVYVPPVGTASFAGEGRPYPVVFWSHGGGGISGDKSMGSYLMRSLALEGIVAVSTNYRLGWDTPEALHVEDVAQAFRWTRDHVGSPRYGGDPANMVVFGYSAGALGIAGLATQEKYAAEQRSIRALVLASFAVEQPGDAAALPPALLLNGDEGELERDLQANSASWSTAYEERGAGSNHVIVRGRDHLTMVSNLARTDDPGRSHLMSFLRKHLAGTDEGAMRPTGGGVDPAPAARQLSRTLPATGPPGGRAALGLLLALVTLAAAAQLRLGRPVAPREGVG